MAELAPTCIAMIDGLGFSTIEDASLFQWLTARSAYRPGMGYSFTQKTELLQGLWPEDQGVLNVWQCSDPSPARMHYLNRLLSVFRDICPFADKVLHYAVARVVKGTANIPFEFKGKFDAVTINPYEQNVRSIIGDKDWRLFIGDDDTPLNDQLPLAKLEEAVNRNDGHLFFAALAEQDHIGHVAGPQGAPYITHARMLDQRLRVIATTFLKHNPDGRFIVVSDHGMIGVTQTVALKGHTFDLKNGMRAPYWLDSTMLRVWTTSDQETDLIENRLKDYAELIVLSDDERQNYGIGHRCFGSIICLTQPGIVFRPDCFGVGRPKGMHGYHPTTSRYQPVIGWANGAEAASLNMPEKLNSIQIYTLLKQLSSGTGH